MSTHWLLRHPEIDGVCLLSDAELIAFWDGANLLPDSVRPAPVNLVPFEQFLAAAKLKARTGSDA